MTRDDARSEALTYVHEKLLHGTTAVAMRREPYMARGGPGEVGYELSRGRITVPGVTGPKPRHTFRTDDLVAELEAEAREAFWRHWRQWRIDRSCTGYLGLAIKGLRAIGVRRGLLPVPPGPARFEHLSSTPVQGELFQPAQEFQR